MAGSTAHSRVWELVRAQHGVIARWQLVELGYSVRAIEHRIASGRLHPLFRGVYAVGRREVTQEGIWMAAVLTCGHGAVLSHESAAQLWGIRPQRRCLIDVSVPIPRDPRPRAGIKVHRRRGLGEPRRKLGIPLTSPIQTLIDLAPCLDDAQLERTVNEADKLDLVHPAQLRRALEGVRGAKRLRAMLDTATFSLTDSDLERRFLPIARKAGLPKPHTRIRVNGFKVDFYWPELGLVVETDGGRFHRTPSQQRNDRRRDQAHTLAGLTPLRFTHGQIAFEPDYVVDVLRRVAGLERTRPGA